MKTKSILIILIFISIKIYSQQTDKTFIAEIPFVNISPQKATQSYFSFAECRQSYFKINLTSFDIAVDKKFLKKYSPLAYVEVKMGERKFVKLIGDQDIKFSKNNDKTSIRSIKNTPIIGYLPYTGEDVTITISLYANKTEDKINESFKIIQNMTGLISTQLLQDVNTINSLYSDLDALLKKSGYLLSYQHTFNPFQQEALPNTFKEGYFIFYDQKNPIDPNQIKIEGLRTLYNDNLLENEKFNYVLLNFDHTTKIPDYSRYDFYLRFNEALRYATERNEKIAKEIFVNDVLSKINANPNLTNYNKKLLHRYLYLQLSEVIIAYNKDFIIDTTPNIDCLITPTVNYTFSADDEQQKETLSKEEMQRNKNIQEFDKLKLSVSYDTKINRLLEEGKLKPSEVVDEMALREMQ